MRRGRLGTASDEAVAHRQPLPGPVCHCLPQGKLCGEVA